MSAVDVIYHVTTPKKAKRYRETGAILAPIRGFDSLLAAMAWACKTGRTVIYAVPAKSPLKLPDHHNRFGEAYWLDENAEQFTCVFSADGDA